MNLPPLQFELNSNELSYLLATVGAKSVWGIDSEQLFPESEAARQERYEQGFIDLQADGWLQRANETSWEVDPNILWIAAIVANPAITLITTHNGQDDGQQIAIHYLAEQAIVELIYTESQTYRLTTLPDQATLLSRITTAILPASGSLGEDQPLLIIPTDLLEKIGTAIQSGLVEQAQAHLQSAGIRQGESSLLSKILAQAKRIATFEISRVMPDTIFAQQEMIVLQTAEGIWLMSADDQPESVRFEAVDATKLSERLATVLSALWKIEVRANPH